MAKYHVKGLSLAVIRDYKIAWAKGYGWADEAEKKPMTTEMLFEPGSIS
jgi:CubicO group peptidase (beta-lactamase class C family)